MKSHWEQNHQPAGLQAEAGRIPQQEQGIDQRSEHSPVPEAAKGQVPAVGSLAGPSEEPLVLAYPEEHNQLRAGAADTEEPPSAAASAAAFLQEEAMLYPSAAALVQPEEPA